MQPRRYGTAASLYWTGARSSPTVEPMSKPSKAAETVKSADQEVPFEEALAKLEAIVAAMEGDDLPLESLLTKFEEGTKLAQVCQAKLADAELKIQQLEKNLSSELVLKPVALSAEEADE